MSINPNIDLNTLLGNKFDDDLKAIKALGKLTHYQKGDLVLTEGDSNDFILFVEEGCFRTFREIEDKEVVVGFTFKGDIECSPMAVIQELPSRDNIQAVTDCVAIKVNRNDIFKKNKSQPQLNKFLNFLLSSYIEVLTLRLVRIKKFTAEENYKVLLNQQPHHLALIPDKYIASYLGITKERLSRIRKKLQLT